MDSYPAYPTHYSHVARAPTFKLLGRLASCHPEATTDTGWRGHPETPEKGCKTRPKKPTPLPLPIDESTTTAPASAKALLLKIAHHHRIDLRTITGESRDKYLVMIRQQAMFELRNIGLSTPNIGRLLNRDHTTVLSGIRRHVKRTAERADAT